MLIIVLPAYNEEQNILKLLETIQYNMDDSHLSYEAIVVDDGSTDRTAELVEQFKDKMPVYLIKHEKNKGLGEAIRTGLLESVKKAKPRDIVLTLDSDNTHTPGLVLRMTRMIREGNDVIIASRFQKGARTIGVPFFRRMLSFGAGFIIKILFPTWGVRDFTSGYRAYRAEIISAAFDEYGNEFIQQSGFTCMIDILLKLRKMGVLIGEVPLILRYDFKLNSSKMDVRQTIGDTLSYLIRMRLGLRVK